jgi:predicted transcriptional regulator
MATTPDTTTVRLPRDLVDQIRRLAERHDRTLSAELREALRHYIREHEEQDS